MAGLPLTALIVCLFMSAGESQGFTIQTEQKQIIATVGDNAFFNVKPSVAISGGNWVFNGTTIIQWVGTGESINIAYKPRVEVFTNNGSFRLKSVKVSDRGDYRVDMTPKSGSNAQLTIALQVHEKFNVSPGGLSTGAIAGIVIGIFAGVTIVAGLAAWLIKTNVSRVKGRYIHDTPITTGVNNTVAKNVGNSSNTYENIPRNQNVGAIAKSTTNPIDENSTYMGLNLEDRAVYNDLRSFHR